MVTLEMFMAVLVVAWSSWLVLRPFFVDCSESAEQQTDIAGLAQSLAEIEDDFQLGKISEEEYRKTLSSLQQ